MRMMKDVSRVTLVLPKALWEDVKRLIPSGGRSRLVAEALEAEIRRRKRLEQVSHIRQLQELMRAKYGELPSGAEDIERMREERDGGI
jgi:metal-responsive CopG/Arc/MetJ family transcriptional regulator